MASPLARAKGGRMRRNTMLAYAVLLLVLGAMAAKSLLVSLPPLRAQNAAGEFDARRAKARLAFVLGDQRPHPADSAGDDAVRARLVATLRQMGLHPIVRDQVACNGFAKALLVACARVRNVVAVLGPPNGTALLLSAHYDSVPVGPGAADDGIGVATLLEVASTLRNRPLRRPIIFLFNEGEELGLIGARAFLADPLSRNVDSLLNFEARGVTGPAMMFETSQPNGAAISVFAGALRNPSASSMATDVARLIPNDTDVSVYKERGWLILNYAIAGNETRYHSPGDNLAGLDPRSLQHMGDQALAVVTRLADGPPQTAGGGNRIFMDVVGRAFVQIPLLAGVALFVALLALFAAVAWRRAAIVRPAAVVLAALVGASALSWLAVTVMGAVRAGDYWRATPAIAFIAIYATALFVIVAALRALAAKLDRSRLRIGFWLVFLMLGGALALVAPGALIYFLLPPAVALVGIALARRYPPAERIAALMAVLLLYLTWGEMLAELEMLFSPGPLWIVAPIGTLIMIPALIEAQPIFRDARRAALLGFAGLVAIIGWAAAAVTPAYSQDHQQRFTIEHVTLFPSGRSSWSVLNDGADVPAAYSGIGDWRLGKLPFSERTRWLAAAPPLTDLKPPSLKLVEAVRNGSDRTLRLRLHTNGAERVFLVADENSHIRAAGARRSVRSVPSAGSPGKVTIACTGRSCDGMELTIVQSRAAPLPITIVGARNGLPASAAPLTRGRPGFARPQYTPDETLAIARIKL